MFGSNVTSHVKHSRLMDEFDKFAAKEGESLESVYERLTMLMNIMDGNNVRPIPVTHPSSVVDYEDEYQRELQGDSQEDKLKTAMMLLAQAITQKFSTPTNIRLRTSANIRNQALVQDGRVDIQTKNVGYGRNGNRNAGRQNRNQAFNAGNENDYSNQIVQCVSRTESTLEKANDNYNEKGHYVLPSYDAKAVSEVKVSSKVQEQVSHVKCKTIIQTCDDDQIDSNIEFDYPCMENNGGTSDHDSNAHDEYHEIQMLAYNVQREAENQKRLNNELKKQKELLQKELETCKDRFAKKAFKERENRYLEDIVDLKEKLSSHDRIVYKIGQSIQTIHMLGKKSNKVYDLFLKAGLGYKNLKRLKKAIAAQPKIYDGERLHGAKLTINLPDSEETLEDAEESRLKMRNKMVQINNGKLNALYETFVPQQEFSIEQAYFSIPSTFNNDLLITISELKNKLQTVDNEKNVNTKFEKFETSRTLLCITPLPKNIAVRAKKVSNTKVNTDRSKSATSHLTPKKEQSRKHNENALARGMLSHLNFDTINQLTLKYLVDGLSKLKYNKDHLCSAYEEGKSKKASLPPKLVLSTESKLELLHMDLCGPMMVASINGNVGIKSLHEVTAVKLMLLKFNFSKYIFESMVKNLDNMNKFLMYPRVEKDFSRKETPLFPTMMVQAQEEMGEGSANPTDPNHTPIIIQPSTSQPQKTKQHRKPRRKVIEVPQPSDPTEHVDEAVNEEMDNSLERAATTATSLDAEQDRKSSDDNEYLGEDASKQRKISDIDTDEGITLVSTHDDAEMFDGDQDLHGEEEKGKAKMIKEHVKLKKKDQIMLDEEVALKLQAELQAEFDKEQKLAREKAQQIKEVNIAWNDVQAKINADYELAQRLLVNTFVDYKTEVVLQSLKKSKAKVIKGSSKRAGEELKQKNAKKQKIDYDKDIAELKQLVKIIPDEEGAVIDAIPLAVKPSSIVNTFVDYRTELVLESSKKAKAEVTREDEAPQIVSLSAEKVATEPNSPVLNENTDELVQEDIAEFDGNVFCNPPPTHVFEEAESSSTYHDPSDMHEFHQKHHSSDK
nr:retrovirus-related Pol polyprotein from transposon TNT 1-94 [Tanacetum cinerariifolium]